MRRVGWSSRRGRGARTVVRAAPRGRARRPVEDLRCGPARVEPSPCERALLCPRPRLPGRGWSGYGRRRTQARPSAAKASCRAPARRPGHAEGAVPRCCRDRAGAVESPRSHPRDRLRDRPRIRPRDHPRGLRGGFPRSPGGASAPRAAGSGARPARLAAGRPSSRSRQPEGRPAGPTAVLVILPASNTRLQVFGCRAFRRTGRRGNRVRIPDGPRHCDRKCPTRAAPLRRDGAHSRRSPGGRGERREACRCRSDEASVP